jgi:hypothetical protein
VRKTPDTFHTEDNGSPPTWSATATGRSRLASLPAFALIVVILVTSCSTGFQSLDISYQKTDGMLLLTGTTEEVQDLLFRHGSDDGAFPEPITMARQGMEQ